MSDFRAVRGFEDVWRPPVRIRAKRPEVRHVARPDSAVRSRLARIAARTPEVMVKVTGRTRDPGHLAAHLSYITRNGDLVAEDRDRCEIAGRDPVMEVARDWAIGQMADSRRRLNSPFSVGLILSMPAGTDAIGLREAAHQFANRAFGDRFEYLLALHTDTGHPHVHLTVRALANDGSRLNPNKADLEAWRQDFADALRDNGIPAEATPRRARGVTRKAERTSIRKIRERAVASGGQHGTVHQGAHRDAAKSAFGGDRTARPWEQQTARRQRQIRGLYQVQAQLLQLSADGEDRALGAAILKFVRGMPAPDTQRLALARALRAANERVAAEAREQKEPPAGSDRLRRR